jgi:hypothetical protein
MRIEQRHFNPSALTLLNPAHAVTELRSARIGFTLEPCVTVPGQAKVFWHVHGLRPKPNAVAAIAGTIDIGRAGTNVAAQACCFTPAIAGSSFRGRRWSWGSST